MEMVDLDRASPTRLALRRSQSPQFASLGRQQQHQQQQQMEVTPTYRSPAICFMEVLTILLFIIYIYLALQTTETSDHSPVTTTSNYPAGSTSNSTNSTNYLTYSDSIGQSARILTGLVSGCSQRLHDLAFGGIKCESKNVSACQLIVGHTNGNRGDDNDTKGASLSSVDNEQQPLEKEDEEAPSSALIVTSSKLGLRFQTQQVPLKQIKCYNGATDSTVDLCRFITQLTVYLSEPQQEIIGWGGALTDSTINNILSLSTNGTKQLLDDYFGLDGLMYNMARITIGGSDFSSRFYTNDDLDDLGDSNGTSQESDLALRNFQLMEEDLLYKIPMLKYIRKQYDSVKVGRELKVFASIWSPPIWMKTNGRHYRGELKGSISSDLNERTADERFYRALAGLKKNFLLAYQNNSINLWGLTVANEPRFSMWHNISFNSMRFSGENYGSYVAKYLGPTIKGDARLNHIKIMIHDDNRRYLMNYTEPILSMDGVRQYVDGVATHGYIDENYLSMDQIYAKHHSIDHPDFFVLPSELCSGHLPFMEKALIGNWARGVHYALDIIRSLQHSAAGWVDWNMALDTSGGPGWLGGRLDSPVIVDKTNDAFYKSPMFYAMGHFSRYVQPQSVKLKTEIINDAYDYHFETVTFLLPDKQNLVTVILNNNPYPIKVYIRFVDQNQIQELNSDAVTLSEVSCPGESITTITYSKELNTYKS